MATINRNIPLVVIVGPTASGKTDLAMKLAVECGGEILCADSRTIYRGMDIGTAKPSVEEQRAVPHHLLDIREPGQPFSVAEFQTLARQAISEIRGRGNVPFLVGGSGLYVDSIIFDYKFSAQADDAQRQRLEQLSLAELHEYCSENNIQLPENAQNKRYVIRAIEQNGVNIQRQDVLIEDCLVVGISTNKDTLRQRITHRADALFGAGMMDEAIRVGLQYGWNNEAMTGNVYRLAKAVYEGDLSLDAARERFITLDWRLAKRQLTWFKRNPFIHWGDRQELDKLIRTYLVSNKTC